MASLQILVQVNESMLVKKIFWAQSPGNLSKAHQIQRELFHDKDLNKACYY